MSGQALVSLVIIDFGVEGQKVEVSKSQVPTFNLQITTERSELMNTFENKLHIKISVLTFGSWKLEFVISILGFHNLHYLLLYQPHPLTPLTPEGAISPEYRGETNGRNDWRWKKLLIPHFAFSFSSLSSRTKPVLRLRRDLRLRNRKTIGFLNNLLTRGPDLPNSPVLLFLPDLVLTVF